MDLCLDWQQEVLEPVFNAVESSSDLNEVLPDRWAEEMCNRRRQVGMFIVAIVCLILSPFCRDLCISWMVVTDWNVEALCSNLTGGGDSGHFCEPTTKKQFVRHSLQVQIRCVLMWVHIYRVPSCREADDRWLSSLSACPCFHLSYLQFLFSTAFFPIIKKTGKLLIYVNCLKSNCYHG